MGRKKQSGAPPLDIPALISRVKRPSRVVVTAGMPYANGPVHVGHLAGAHLPADIYARWYDMVVGREDVVFVSGNDDHGSTSEIAALKAGKPVREFIQAALELRAHGSRRAGQACGDLLGGEALGLGNTAFALCPGLVLLSAPRCESTDNGPKPRRESRLVTGRAQACERACGPR